MVYNLIIWTAYGMALLIIASLYFSYLKLKITFRGIEAFILGQFFIATSLFLLWFLDETTKYYITPLIGIFLFFGAYLFHKSVLTFCRIESKPIDLYILLPVGFIIYNYYLYMNESLVMQVVSLYLAASYIYFKSAILITLSKRNVKESGTYILALIVFGFGMLYLFRVINVVLFNLESINYNNLKDYQTLTVILTFLLQIFLTFNVSNLIYSKARDELNKINSGFHHSPLSMIMINEFKQVVDANSRFTDFFGYNITQIIGKNVSELELFKEVIASHDFTVIMTSNKSFHNKEFRVIKFDGTVKQTLISISEINYVDQQNSIITFTDISEIYLLQEKLTDYAYYDELTNLPNRRYLTRYFDAKIVDSHCFSLVCIDLDNFKDVNDNHGHTIGDEVLRYISKRLMRAMCDNDFVARYAGDEFIVILDLESHKHTLEERISKIIEAIESVIQISDLYFNLKASFGLSEFPLHGMTLNDLIEKADTEMYKIKRFSKSNAQI